MIMNANYKSAALCVGLFVVSFVIMLSSRDTGYVPSSDYNDTALAVMNEFDYVPEASAINPTSANNILNILEYNALADENKDDDIIPSSKSYEVLPPILTPPANNSVEVISGK